MDPKTAMMCGKGSERVFESIPGSILRAVDGCHAAGPRECTLAVDAGIVLMRCSWTREFKEPSGWASSFPAHELSLGR